MTPGFGWICLQQEVWAVYFDDPRSRLERTNRFRAGKSDQAILLGVQPKQWLRKALQFDTRIDANRVLDTTRNQPRRNSVESLSHCPRKSTVASGQKEREHESRRPPCWNESGKTREPSGERGLDECRAKDDRDDARAAVGNHERDGTRERFCNQRDGLWGQLFLHPFGQFRIVASPIGRER